MGNVWKGCQDRVLKIIQSVITSLLSCCTVHNDADTFHFQKEWNPQIAMIHNGAYAFQGFMSDINSGTRVSSPKLNSGKEMPAQRTAPTKPMPWHLYKNTLLSLPAFLRDSSVPPPTIDDKLFNLMIGNLDHINSNPSINSNKQTGQVCYLWELY